MAIVRDRVRRHGLGRPHVCSYGDLTFLLNHGEVNLSVFFLETFINFVRDQSATSLTGQAYQSFFAFKAYRVRCRCTSPVDRAGPSTQSAGRHRAGNRHAVPPRRWAGHVRDSRDPQRRRSRRALGGYVLPGLVGLCVARFITLADAAQTSAVPSQTSCMRSDHARRSELGSISGLLSFRLMRANEWGFASSTDTLVRRLIAYSMSSCALTAGAAIVLAAYGVQGGTRFFMMSAAAVWSLLTRQLDLAYDPATDGRDLDDVVSVRLLRRDRVDRLGTSARHSKLASPLRSLAPRSAGHRPGRTHSQSARPPAPATRGRSPADWSSARPVHARLSMSRTASTSARRRARRKSRSERCVLTPASIIHMTLYSSACLSPRSAPARKVCAISETQRCVAHSDARHRPPGP